MANYVLARLKLKFGFSNLATFNENMKLIREFYESNGIMLVQALTPKIGRVNEVLNVWKVDDFAHWERAMATLGDAAVMAKYGKVAAAQTEIVIEEMMGFYETAPYFLDGPHSASK
jgi:hypothetical protein